MQQRSRDWLKARLVRSRLLDILETGLFLREFVGCLARPQLAGLLAESLGQRALLKSLIRPGMVCVDVGAHVGRLLARIVQMAPHGKHWAFEPDVYKASLLQQLYPDVRVEALALGATATRAGYRRHPKNTALNRLVSEAERRPGEKEVEVRTLDSFELAPDFVKLDVEGLELEVLRGAAATLQSFRPTLLFECVQTNVDKYAIKPAELFKFLTEDFDYRIFTTLDWLTDSAHLELDAFCSAVRYPFKAHNFIALPSDG